VREETWKLTIIGPIHMDETGHQTVLDVEPIDAQESTHSIKSIETFVIAIHHGPVNPTI